ncbi:glutamate racemase [Photorhabdus heterorhabditis]|uniref:glutamate racemase n=1 Tax=Photorhabdus heterorhabditis TaxID=880156 RepID=UPI0015621CA1|nr:glutamate racemase [Photorhabdus heterorhabditis]NRN29448.1 glutamate racemase [Photorhabdus heterorhabditis subsp. aluminescens]
MLVENTIILGKKNIEFYNANGDSIEKINTDSPRILIFDSGVGGLSVSKYIENFFLGTDVVYIADNKFYPYGNKDRTLLLERIEDLLEQAVQIFEPIGLIIACNTASTLLSNSFTEKLKMPCIKVLPPILEAFQISSKKNVLLIATPNTIDSEYVNNICAKLIDDKFIFKKLGLTELVNFSEMKSRGISLETNDIESLILRSMTKEEVDNVDVVILGCTHFPNIKDELKYIFKNVKEWVDPAYDAVNSLYQAINQINSQNGIQKFLFLTEQSKVDNFTSPYEYSGFL